MKLFKFDKQQIDFIPVNKFFYLLKYIGITIGLCLTIGVFTSLKYVEDEKTRFIQSEEIIHLITNDSFSQNAFIDYIKNNNFKYPDIIIAQAYIESSYFTSPVWNENNNIFGMRVPQSRFTLAVGENLKHAVYKNWKDSVKDRMIYEALYLYKIKTKKQYYAYLDKIYASAGETKYSDLIKQIIKQKQLNK
jgi:uncharacterized FlgJ-related protein